MRLTIPPKYIHEESWGADEYAANFNLLPNGDSAVVFQYRFPENSCFCTTFTGSQPIQLLQI